ncbi:MAG: SPOR domain-containing protein [Phycisphaerae bacterium]|nr:SPOR domain-containing protein [Phycisphaerae bacterium]
MGMTRRWKWIAWSGMIALAVAGCETSGSRATVAGSDYAELYKQRRYEEAYRQAESAYNSSAGAKRNWAALTAGLSAHALQRNASAEGWLVPLLESDDSEVAGRAGATLGLIAQSRGQHEHASAMLIKASGQLSGNEAAQARKAAGDSLWTIGRQQEARTQWAMAGAAAKDSKVKAAAGERLGGSEFAIQLGAFSDRGAAERSAAAARGPAERAGQGSPRIVEGQDSRNRSMYFVQVGRFASRSTAKETLNRLGIQGIITIAK